MNTDTIIASLRTLFASHPDLLAALGKERDLDSAADFLAQTGAQYGIPVNAGELRRHVRGLLALPPRSPAAQDHELPESALDAIAAGAGAIDPLQLMLQLVGAPPR